jgi:hypothetical protein
MRADLLALTPESIAALANLGLVKRATREIEQGKGPSLVEEADGTVVGTFEDAVSRLLPGKMLRDCPCTCGSVAVCRHRVAVALAYPAFASQGAEAAPPEPLVSPGLIENETILKLVGKRVMDDARLQAKRGVAVEVVRPEPLSKEPQTARLPSCTVRFLVPKDVAYARCDCQVGQGCVHVVLAVWAFREADLRDATSLRCTVEVRHGAKAKEAPNEDASARARELVLDILLDGIVHAREALAQRFALARGDLEQAKQTWPRDALEDLELHLERYRARSARFRTSDVLLCAAEIIARTRAARAPSNALPASVILGQGEAMETKLDHTRLVGLGCRFESDDQTRSVEVFFADPDTGTVLVLEKAWSFAAGEAIPDASELARRRVGSSSIGAMAQGQVVTRVAKRRANRSLTLSQNAQGNTSVTPQTGDFSILPEPLRVARFADLAKVFASRPPRLVRARVRADDVHVLAVARVTDVVFDAGEQCLLATLWDAEDAPMMLRLEHRGVAPRALDALGEALLGAHGPLRWVAGSVHAGARGLVIDPTLVVCDRVIVPDALDVGSKELPKGRAGQSDDVLSRALSDAWIRLEELAQIGLRHATREHLARLRGTVNRLESLGLLDAGTRLSHLASATEVALKNTDKESAQAAALFLLDSVIRIDLLRELHTSEAVRAMAREVAL